MRTPHDLFLPRPGSTPGRIWPKNNNTCKGPWVLHPYQVSSKSIKQFWRRSRKCEKFTPDGRTDGRTNDDGGRRTDGRRTVRYDNISLEPSAQVNQKKGRGWDFEIYACVRAVKFYSAFLLQLLRPDSSNLPCLFKSHTFDLARNERLPHF